MSISVFLSTVSDEFRLYRDQLDADLSTPRMRSTSPKSIALPACSYDRKAMWFESNGFLKPLSAMQIVARGFSA
jgi:hypothetical protein